MNPVLAEQAAGDVQGLDVDGVAYFITGLGGVSRYEFGEKLPESTYYYVLDLGDDKESHTGYIFLRR